MKTEDKELLRDLCARLPYGVKVKTSFDKIDEPTELKSINIKNGTFSVGGEYTTISGISLNTYECKPYLFPLSSMSREQLNDFYATIRPVIEESLEEYGNDKTDMKTIKCDIVAVNWMLKNHFDINGLLPMDLAIDATDLNIYKEEIK